MEGIYKHRSEGLGCLAMCSSQPALTDTSFQMWFYRVSGICLYLQTWQLPAGIQLCVL